MEAALALGGTITGEHGIGVLKARHLVSQLGGVRARAPGQARPRSRDILNPGKPFPD